MMKYSIKKYVLALILITLLPVTSQSAGWDDVDWVTCGPSGISQRLKLMSDKKQYWASQHTNIEMILKTNSLIYDSRKQDCYLNNHKSDVKYAACLIALDTQMENIARCLKHARDMCQINGGYCN